MVQCLDTKDLCSPGKGWWWHANDILILNVGKPLLHRKQQEGIHSGSWVLSSSSLSNSTWWRWESSHRAGPDHLKAVYLKDICAYERFPHENVPGESLTDPSRGISSLGMWPRKGSKEGQPDTESSVGSAYSQGLWFSRHLVGKLPNNRTVHTLRDETPEETR